MAARRGLSHLKGMVGEAVWGRLFVDSHPEFMDFHLLEKTILAVNAKFRLLLARLSESNPMF